jgi:hypothetical protein
VAPVNVALALLHQPHRAGFAAMERTAARRAHAVGMPPDPAFHADMRRLHEALLAAPLTPIGRLAARTEITRRLTNRYALRRLFDRHPEVSRLAVDRPVVVTGLPRTGTTLLHDLLARHGGARAPQLWELLHPVPGSPAGRRRALRSTRWTTRMYHAAVPALCDIHPLDPRAPEECIFVLPHHHGHQARARMPDYHRWCEARDAADDYRYLRHHLQALQWRRSRRRWVLKSPFHLHHLDALLAAFPDATVVWTRRDPVRAMASWCSFVEAIMWLQNDRVDRAAIGRDWLEIWATGLAQGARTRAAHPGRFIDVDYGSLAADPVATTVGLWECLGDPVDGPARARIATAASGAQHRPGRHRYRLERYGLDPDEVRARLTRTP